MATSIQLDLVTPDCLLISKEVTSVSVPGQEGEFGVLPDHTPLMTGVVAGEITIDDGGSAGERYAVSNGYAEVTAESVTVLVDRAIVREEIKVQEAEAELQTALEAIATAPEPTAKSHKIDPTVILQKRSRDFARACILVSGKQL